MPYSSIGYFQVFVKYSSEMNTNVLGKICKIQNGSHKVSIHKWPPSKRQDLQSETGMAFTLK